MPGINKFFLNLKLIFTHISFSWCRGMLCWDSSVILEEQIEFSRRFHAYFETNKHEKLAPIVTSNYNSLSRCVTGQLLDNHNVAQNSLHHIETLNSQRSPFPLIFIKI